MPSSSSSGLRCEDENEAREERRMKESFFLKSSVMETRRLGEEVRTKEP